MSTNNTLTNDASASVAESPVVEKEIAPALWSVAQVQEWLQKQQIPSDIVELFGEHEINGAVLKQITIADMTELDVPAKWRIHTKLAINKLFPREIEQELVMALEKIHVSLQSVAQVAKARPSQGSSVSSPASVQPIMRPPLRSHGSGSTFASQPGTPGTPAVRNEPLKQLRASKEDSCEKVLRNAMKRHNLLQEDWREYVLVVVYGDKERILELDEKPVMVFKTLKEQGLHPAIMLRQRGDFSEAQFVPGATPGGKL